MIPFVLVPQFQQQQQNAVQHGDDKNAGSGFIAPRVDVKRKENNIGQQAKAAQRGDEPVFGNKVA